MNKLKTTAVSAKNAVVRNKTRIYATAAVVSTTVAVVQHSGLKQHNQFLREKGLFEEFYNSEI